MTGAGAIVEILKTAGLLREEAGELVATFEEWPETDEPAPPKEPEESSAEVSATVEALPPAGPAPAVSIHVQVRCTADEIEDLGPKLKSLIAQLSGSA
jgi:hypothetical protein